MFPLPHFSVTVISLKIYFQYKVVVVVFGGGGGGDDGGGGGDGWLVFFYVYLFNLNVIHFKCNVPVES